MGSGRVYLILGCGDVGFSVASRLKEMGAEVVVVDKNAKRVEQLKAMGYRALVGDIGLTDVLKEAGIAQADTILIMVSDFSATQAALGAINTLKVELKVDPVVVARVSDEAEVDEVKWLGASEALPSPQIIAEHAISEFEKLSGMAKEKRLRALLQRRAKESRGKLAIILQRNPDPDSIASGVALKLYAKAFGVDADIIYDGFIGHLQNRALINLLGVTLLEADKVNFDSYESFALVDVATHANCCLPNNIDVPTIVIDHHSVPSGEVHALHLDLSPVGAASTLLTFYLRYAAVEIDRATAAALVLGILTDTMNFTRGATPLDFDAFRYLMGIADAEVLGKLLVPTISSDALEALAIAIRVSKIRAGYLTANLGEVKSRDLLAQAADFLLNREGVNTTFIYGVCGDAIYASARTRDVGLHLGQALKKAFSDIGSGGGHPHMAGATIPLKVLGKTSKEKIRRELDRVIGRRFLEAVGVVKPSRARRKQTK
jgi:nanoRNase/pAp phosphatase (c-di-AMP/oligoRNAs hydrolase)/predicted dinucleotide-binding enzyme